MAWMFSGFLSRLMPDAARLASCAPPPQGYEGMQRDVEKCMRNAHVLKDMLEMVGIKTMLNELSNTVVFERCVPAAAARVQLPVTTSQNRAEAPSQ